MPTPYLVHNQRLKKRILRERGIINPKQVKVAADISRAKLEDAYVTKTDRMRLLEITSGKSITTILWDGSIYDVEAKYGVDATTVSKWRKRVLAEMVNYANSLVERIKKEIQDET